MYKYIHTNCQKNKAKTAKQNKILRENGNTWIMYREVKSTSTPTHIQRPVKKARKNGKTFIEKHENIKKNTKRSA